MIKEPPSLGRMLAMLVFTLGCFGLLIFLWLSFGGSIPLKPQQYRLTVDVPEASNLANEADVRMSGITIGKVKSKALDKGGVATKIVLDIKPKFAPTAEGHEVHPASEDAPRRDVRRAVPGQPEGGYLKDGASISRNAVEPTVELDEIFSAFDKPTRTAFQKWVSEEALAIKGPSRTPTPPPSP